ncbi:MAG: 2-C-methyl-D-erythritol 2,4-cyclodiphosphate synthase [Acidimicrobiales bacterium]
MRVGQGFDVHRFSSDKRKPLVLGGVVIEGEGGLIGHSDADVVTHALCDALLGAAGLGDMGTHFPDTNPALEGADSLSLLAKTVKMVAEGGWEPINADLTVLAERPRIAPHAQRMASILSGIVGAQVSVKATRPEGLGSLGRAEGIAVLAIALLGPIK